MADGHIADVIIVADGDALYLVKGDAAGMKRRELVTADSRGAADITFEGAAAEKMNGGADVIDAILDRARIGLAAEMVGSASEAFEITSEYLKTRKQFGQVIGNFQGVQFQYARCAVEIESARLMVYNAARLKDAGQPFIKEAAMAKLHASEVAERVASLCVEFVGGVGFTKEYPLEKFYRDAKIGKIYEGTSNMQLQTIAKLLQAEYGFKG